MNQRKQRLEILEKVANGELKPILADEMLMNLSIKNTNYISGKLKSPFRVGRKQNRVILDANGLEVAHFFYHGDENMAYDYVKWLNGF